jgi:hypothetical protein
MAETAAVVFRDYETDGVPSSGRHKPKKSAIRAWGGYLESFVTAIGASGSTVYLTRAELFADLNRDAKASAWVIQDPTVAYNGVYRKNGSVGTGSWTRAGDLPYSFINASDTGIGTPDAIQATTPIPVSTSALVLLNIFDTNTGSPVTVSFNGGSPLTVKTNSGNDLAAGGLLSGMIVLGIVSGSTFRLVNDQVSSAIIATAEAAETAAVIAAESAQDAAAAINALLVGVSMLGDGSAFPQGRLSLTAGVATPVSDVAGATTIYYLSAGTGRYVPHWTGAAVLPMNIVAGLSMALDPTSGHTGYHQSGKNFDLFVFDDAGTIRLGSGPSWNSGAVPGSDTARGTGAGSTELESFQGLLTNKNSITLRWGSASGNTVVVPARQATYVGSFRTTADGQATDTKKDRLLFNAFNQISRKLFLADNTASWTYSLTAFRSVRGQASNRVSVLSGLVGTSVSLGASVGANAASGTAGQSAQCAIGLDSVTAPAPDSIFGYGSLTSGTSPLGAYPIHAKYDAEMTLGYHELNWLEAGAGVGAQTFLGSASIGVGMSGKVMI